MRQIHKFVVPNVLARQAGLVPQMRSREWGEAGSPSCLPDHCPNHRADSRARREQACGLRSTACVCQDLGALRSGTTSCPGNRGSSMDKPMGAQPKAACNGIRVHEVERTILRNRRCPDRCVASEDHLRGFLCVPPSKQNHGGIRQESWREIGVRSGDNPRRETLCLLRTAWQDSHRRTQEYCEGQGTRSPTTCWQDV